MAYYSKVYIHRHALATVRPACRALKAWPWLLAVLFACGHFRAFAQQVEVRSGNVYYVAPDGSARQITSLKADSDAAVSPDGKSVIFVRRTATPAGFEEPRELHPVRTEIWIAGVDRSGEAPHLIFGGVVRAWKSSYSTFSEPRLAPDNRHAYFLIMAFATDDAIVQLDIEKREVRVVTTGSQYCVVGNGKYEGDLIVRMRKLAEAGFSQLFWLVSPDGQELGIVGPSEADVQTFLKNPDREVQR